MTGGTSLYNVYLNGTFSHVLNLPSNHRGTQSHQLFLQLDPLLQSFIVISKRTGSLVGGRSEVFHGIEVDEEASLLLPEERSQRRLEVIGDSATSGFGMLSESNDGPACHRTQARNQDSQLTYSLLIAKELLGGSAL